MDLQLNVNFSTLFYLGFGSVLVAAVFLRFGVTTVSLGLRDRSKLLAELAKRLGPDLKRDSVIPKLFSKVREIEQSDDQLTGRLTAIITRPIKIDFIWTQMGTDLFQKIATADRASLRKKDLESAIRNTLENTPCVLGLTCHHLSRMAAVLPWAAFAATQLGSIFLMKSSLHHVVETGAQASELLSSFDQAFTLYLIGMATSIACYFVDRTRKYPTAFQASVTNVLLATMTILSRPKRTITKLPRTPEV